jgi:hypothetical protein
LDTLSVRVSQRKAKDPKKAKKKKRKRKEGPKNEKKRKKRKKKNVFVRAEANEAAVRGVRAREREVRDRGAGRSRVGL